MKTKLLKIGLGLVAGLVARAEVAAESAPGPVDEILEPVVLGENTRFGDLAVKHGMSVSQLNALNGWSFLKDDLLGTGTQVYVKH